MGAKSGDCGITLFWAAAIYGAALAIDVKTGRVRKGRIQERLEGLPRKDKKPLVAIAGLLVNGTAALALFLSLWFGRRRRD